MRTTDQSINTGTINSKLCNADFSCGPVVKNLPSKARDEDLIPDWGTKRGEWKSWLKAQHSENEDHGTMASGPITAWEIDGETMEVTSTLLQIAST